MNHHSTTGNNSGNPAEASLLKKAFLTKNQQIAKGIYEMELVEPDLAAAAQPGQFVMLAIRKGVEPFLRRPFGIAGIQPQAGSIRLIYQATGRGTAEMAGWEAGRLVELLGPLGNGFTWEERPGRVILAGGGMGIAPLLPLAKALRSLDKEVTVFLGARSLDLVFGVKELGQAGCQVQLATEDGSAGAAGFVTLPLESYLQKNISAAPHQDHHRSQPANQPQPSSLPLQGLYACGPTPFLKAVSSLCSRYSLAAQLSLEERMGCGLGACMGCTVQIKDGAGKVMQQRVCYEGPVFRAEEVVFDG